MARIDLSSFKCAIVLCDEHWIDPDHEDANGIESTDEPSMLRLDALMMTVQVGGGAEGGGGGGRAGDVCGTNINTVATIDARKHARANLAHMHEHAAHPHSGSNIRLMPPFIPSLRRVIRPHPLSSCSVCSSTSASAWLMMGCHPSTSFAKR